MWEDTVFYVSATEKAEGTESTESTEEPEATEEPAASEEPENTPENEAENQPESEQQKVRVKTEDGIIVREGPGQSYDVIGDAQDGDEFVKLGVENDANGDEWTKIQYTSSVVGYIKSTFLE
jgi:uncharacterized protein YgiM (DUF1202 family)